MDPPEEVRILQQSNSKLENQQQQKELCKTERKEEEPESSSAPSRHTSSPNPTNEDEQNSSEDESASDKHDKEAKVKEEEGGPTRRGHRPREKQKDPAPKPKSKSSKKKKKQKRMMREPEEDDPRNRGVPKSKKIRKRRNKPKAISEQAKREAEIKREEEEYQRKITNRGKKPVVKKLRGERKKKEKKKSQEEVKLEEMEFKLEQSDQDSSQDSNVKRRTSRKQRKRERDEDKQKVDLMMVARGERDRREQLETLVRAQRMMAVKFGTKMKIQIDPACRFYSQYKCRKGEIEKSGKLYCQIYNQHPVPADGRYFFQMKIARLSFQSVTVGLISAQNFEEQYSRDKPHCICFDAYTHSTYVEGVKTDLQAEIKLNDVIRTVVDLPNTTVHWYINHDFVSEAIIPPHMAALPLFPYLEVSNKWIKLRINDFQQ